MDNMKDFLAGPIHLVSPFMSAHVICSPPPLVPRSHAPSYHDILSLASKNKTEGFFFERMPLPAPKDTLHLLPKGQYIRD